MFLFTDLCNSASLSDGEHGFLDVAALRASIQACEKGKQYYGNSLGMTSDRNPKMIISISRLGVVLSG